MAEPKPNWLGAGMASDAGKKLKGRKSRIDSAVSSATNGKKKRKGEWMDKDKTEYRKKK